MVEYLAIYQKATLEIAESFRRLDEFGPTFALGPSEGTDGEASITDSEADAAVATFSRTAAWLEEAGKVFDTETPTLRGARARLRTLDVFFKSLLPFETEEDRKQAYDLLSMIPGHPEHFADFVEGMNQAKFGLSVYKGKSAARTRAASHLERSIQEILDVVTQGREVAAYLAAVLAERTRDSLVASTLPNP